MGLFGPKKEGEGKKKAAVEQQGLPPLPKLPELPPLKFPSYSPMEKYELKPERLPALPPASRRERFTQAMIKGAVTSEAEEAPIAEEEFAEKTFVPAGKVRTQEYEPEQPAMIQTLPSPTQGMIASPKPEPVVMRTTRKAGITTPEEFQEAAHVVRQKEPVFIRLDKFEEGLHMFEDLKDRIEEIRVLLHDIKNVREKEENELGQWETELQAMKTQIDKIDNDIFSRVQ